MQARGTFIEKGDPHKASIFMVLHLQLRTHSCAHASMSEPIKCNCFTQAHDTHISHVHSPCVQ